MSRCIFNPLIADLVTKALPCETRYLINQWWDSILTCPYLTMEARRVGCTMVNYTFAEEGELRTDIRLADLSAISGVKYPEAGRKELIGHGVIAKVPIKRDPLVGATFAFNRAWLEEAKPSLEDWITEFKEQRERVRT